ncbi:TIM barrel protein [Methanobacterium petrolearium]|uniref:TIM barrel protein n=1 Tax=Methanobacterium petrolearium TaxID=710190 RepID=UPI001AE78D43|nr:TIM barrel protein [Methanobacterium petrolearium]MBP1945038.1 deoxyribonuclease-4 [Methanobacterium petrolearium]
MKQNIRFGPAGNPIGFKGQTVDVCDYIRELGLDAYEYQATYGVRIQKQSGLKLAENSQKNDVRVSMHAPYYINLAAQKEDVLKRSIDRLIQSARAAEWIGAYRIVFHPGFYTKYSPQDALKRCKNSITNLMEDLNSRRMENFIFAPETTGKRSQLGSLEEIIDICQSFDHFAPTIDFAHLHARGRGSIKDIDDYHKILAKLEEELGGGCHEHEFLHCHFTRIEYTDAGERKHHILTEKEYGPPMEPLLEALIECGWNATIICETPLLEQDALLMQKTYKNMVK